MTPSRPPQRPDGISTRQLGGYVLIAAAVVALVRVLRGRGRGRPPKA